jgi:hypothetical protein
MVQVETIDLSAFGIELPTDRVGIVIAQPYTELCHPEPFKCSTTTAQRQIEAVCKTLKVAIAAPHGQQRTHFTVFPEYSIPGIAGIDKVNGALAGVDWPNATIVIGGVDALTRSEYEQLLAVPNTYVASCNEAQNVGQDEWVNCSVTWVKTAEGDVHRWVQPKIHPAWPEEDVNHQDMFRGNSISVFKGMLSGGAPFRFTTLICFDWIAPEPERPWKCLLGDLHATHQDGQTPLSWLFVLEHNAKPSHSTFLLGIKEFFEQASHPRAFLGNTGIIFANVGGRLTPGKSTLYGDTSVVFSATTLFDVSGSPATFANGGKKFRNGSDVLSDARLKDFVFREKGACILSFSLRHPASIVGGAAARSRPIEHAHVIPMIPSTDPRLPSHKVPACVKWFNDELDGTPRMTGLSNVGPLTDDLDTAQTSVINQMRTLPSRSVEAAVELSVSENANNNADSWGVQHIRGITHLVYTMGIFTVAYPTPRVPADPAHATVTIKGYDLDLAAVAGPTHQDCLTHYHKHIRDPRRQMILISRDQENTDWHPAFGSFLRTSPPVLGEEISITDPLNSLYHTGYQNLIRHLPTCPTPPAIAEGILDELSRIS